MAIAFSLDIKILMIYILILEVRILINLSNKIIILLKYLDYIDIFLPKFIAKLQEHNNNNYAIKFKKLNSYLKAQFVA